MNRDIIQTIDIIANKEKVWQVLTSPSCIATYLPGAQTFTDWKVGHSILFLHEDQHQASLDRGTILVYQPFELLMYTYWSQESNLEDSPENYITVAFNLTDIEGQTELSLTEVNFKDAAWYQRSLDTCMLTLSTIKELSEAVVSCRR